MKAKASTSTTADGSEGTPAKPDVPKTDEAVDKTSQVETTAEKRGFFDRFRRR